ncbi:MAG: hypothetical protein ABJN26_25175 [Stappiaceae bacterium]
MENWSNWTDNVTVSAQHPPSITPEMTVRVENGNRTVSVGKARDFNWTLILRYQTAQPSNLNGV